MRRRTPGLQSSLLLLAVLLPAVLLPAAARADQWETLGSRRVDFRLDHDVIPVTAAEGVFTSLRFEVEAGDLEMFNVRVVFGDGSAFSPDTRLVFREGSRSRIIDLPGTARIIRRIEFSYRSTLRRGAATIVVLGRRPGPAAPPPPPVADWVRLGSRAVSFRVERDVIPAAGDGRFRGLRIAVEGGDLEMFDIRVVFGDGSAFSPQTRLTFQEGSWSRDIDLPGDARIIRRVEFAYQSIRATRRGRAVVTVFGRR
jgi:hypothetical protein